MKMIEWGVIPTRSPKAKKSGTDGHLGFFTYDIKGCVSNGEIRTPVLKTAAQAKEMLKGLIHRLCFKMPKGL